MKFGLFKKSLVVGGILMGLILPVFGGNVAFATDGEDTSCRPMLGFTSWDCNSNYESVDSEEDLRNTVLVITFNILTDLTVAASYLVLGWVMWGGYKYMFSKGDVGKVAEGKKTLVNAFIGLAIVMLSSVIFSAIRGVIGSGDMKDVGFDGSGIQLPNVDADTLIINSIQWFIGMAGVVAVIFVVYGGVSYITAAGDAGKLVKAKNSIIYALIGLFIVVLAMVITNFVKGQIDSSKTTAFLDEETPSLAEEYYENKIS